MTTSSDMKTTIHPTAVIDDNVDLGPGVTVGPHAVLHGPSKIGEGSAIDAHAVVHSYTILGPHCRLHSGAVVGDVPQDLEFEPCESFVRIGADTVLREHVTVHRGTKPGTETTIGDGCYLMCGSHVAHNCAVGNQVILVNQALLAGYVTVGDGALLSGHIAVHQFGRVGRLAMMGGHSGASLDVPPFCTTRPFSLNQLLGLNVVGLRRAGIEAGQRRAIKAAYRILFTEKRIREDAVGLIQAEYPAGPAFEMAAFVAASKRGVCRPE